MWLYTKYGVFSVVTSHDGKNMQVRSRVKQYLTDLLADCEMNEKIVQTPERDYEYRIIVSKSKWNKIGSHLISGIDYSDFKTNLSRTGFFKCDRNHDIYNGAYYSYLDA